MADNFDYPKVKTILVIMSVNFDIVLWAETLKIK